MMLQSASPKSATNSDAWPHFWKHGLTLYLSEDLFAPPPCTLLDEKHVQALTQTKLPRPTPSLAQLLFESCTGVTGVGSEDSKAAYSMGVKGSGDWWPLRYAVIQGMLQAKFWEQGAASELFQNASSTEKRHNHGELQKERGSRQKSRNCARNRLFSQPPFRVA